jgi:hypothetical protein
MGYKEYLRFNMAFFRVLYMDPWAIIFLIAIQNFQTAASY